MTTNMTSIFDDAVNFEFSLEDSKYSKEKRFLFVQKFPESELLFMPIEKYADVKSKDTFIYWLEFKKILQGIGGGKASKFGIYKINSDGQYYIGTRNKKKVLIGEELEKNFTELKKGIIKLLEYFDNSDFRAIENLKLPIWDMVLIKILCLYRPDKLLNISKSEILKDCAKALEIENFEKIDTILLNRLCFEKLRELGEFRGWDNAKLSTYIWHKFNKSEVNYWIFQCNPNDFDFESAIRNNDIDNWTVKSHKEKIKNQDKAIIWLTGKKSGCYALAEITSEPKFVESSTDDKYWKTEVNSRLAADIKITHNFIDKPIFNEFVKNTKGLENFKGGTQGTNFSATKKEYELFLKIINGNLSQKYWLYAPGENARVWNEVYDKGIMAIGWEELGDLTDYQTRQDIADKLDEIENETKKRPNDSLANFQFANEISVGDIIIPKRGKVEYLGYGVVTSDYYFDDSRQEYKSCRKVEWKKKGVWKENEGDIVLKTLTNITSYSDYVEKLKKLIGIEQQEEPKLLIGTIPLNQILYGPPGTGKTYNTIEKAVEIINGKSADSHEENKKIFDELRKEGQIEFVTFHQNYSYEDFVVGIFPDVSAGILRFDKKEGIFKKIAHKAKQNWLASKDEGKIRLDFDFVFNKFFAKLFEEEITEIEISMRRPNYIFKITSVDLDDGKIKFTKQSGGTGHDLLIKNVKAIFEGTLNYGSDGIGVYYYPLVDELKKFAETIKPLKQKEELKNFVLIIDEINRANISKVFGELITLLEDDKRLGRSNELKVTLPNGEMDFGVPPNLYVIGTMNTADKSIALIDIALRRRFEFIGFYPNYDLIKGEAADLLKAINTAIFERKKSADYLIGHAYFMQNKSIENILKYKILPLLMEYFAGKTEIVSSLFSDTDWEIFYNPITYDWTIQNI